MPAEPLHIFDPRRNFQTQGFTGKAATTTMYNATETGVSISGIFQAPDDFAVLGWWNSYDYFNHLRCKHLPRTDLSGLKLEFDIEYDHALDGAMRFDAAKYPSVSWDSMTFVCGRGIAPNDIYEVPLLDHATVVSGSETPASVEIDLSGEEPAEGIDYLHLYFRDARYTITHFECRFETQLTSDVAPATDASGNLLPVDLHVEDATGFEVGDMVWIERTGANEELVLVLEVNQIFGFIRARITMTHANDSYITRKTTARHASQKFADLINTAGETVAGRFGPDQTAVIEASAVGYLGGGTLSISFKTAALPAARYGKLGNLDRVLATSGHDGAGTQTLDWYASGSTYHFTGGDNNTKYHIMLDFTQPLLDKQSRTVPMNDCRKIYTVFAPRFEQSEGELEDGCFLTSGVGPSDTVWQVDDSSKISGGRYFIGSPTAEERVRLISVDSPTQITVERGYQSSTPGSWDAGARMKKLSPQSGFSSDVEWGCTISNITVTGDGSLKVGGAAPRIEESDARCTYTGYWEKYSYGSGWPSQWWSTGHARRCAPSSAQDVRKVSLRYSYTQQHDLYLGTFLNTDCGKVSISVDGDAPTTHDLFLSEYGGTTANIKLRGAVAAGTHTVEITALFEKHASSTGYYFYFDYLWPLVPQDVPDAPQEYTDVSLAIDFDTDHGYKKPPAWHLWQLQKLGFKGHADVYMVVFWNNKRRRVGATYPYATIAFSGTPSPGDVVWFSIGGTTINHAIGYGETLQQIVSHFRAAINGMFAGVWADDNFGTSTTLRIQSKAPSWAFTGLAVSTPNSVTLTLTNQMGTPGSEGDWEMVDSVTPVMTEGARRWIRDLAGQFQTAGIKASFAFSMECYNPPAQMRAKYLSYSAGVVSPGADVFLQIPSHQMHFGTRVRNYLKQMYKECADQVAAAGAPVILQFGETQYWYFDNQGEDPNGGMGFYDQGTIDDFATAKGHQIWPFRANNDDPAGDPAHQYETANFLRDRIWTYCQDVISYVRSYHPTAVFECLWPLDANQGKPQPSSEHRRLLMHVNLPNEWKNSSYGIKYFRCEGFDYDVWQKNSSLIRQVASYPKSALGRPAEECMFLSGIYGPPDPPIAQAYGMWLPLKTYSFCLWAFDQFCLNSRQIPLPIYSVSVSNAQYFKPRAARAMEASTAQAWVPAASGALNQFRSNTRACNE
ncbi:MAG: hypothetical protein HY820_18905 [Acidobacteria bacterium]|nr:hypothetical protein [Acidobacteriota bacterium]